MEEQKTKKSDNKERTMLEIIAVSIQTEPLHVLERQVEEICRKYFPDCNIFLINEFRYFAFAVRDISTSTISIDEILKDYEKTL